MGSWSSGYDAALTRRMSPVRTAITQCALEQSRDFRKNIPLEHDSPSVTGRNSGRAHSPLHMKTTSIYSTNSHNTSTRALDGAARGFLITETRLLREGLEVGKLCQIVQHTPERQQLKALQAECYSAELEDDAFFTRGLVQRLTRNSLDGKIQGVVISPTTQGKEKVSALLLTPEEIPKARTAIEWYWVLQDHFAGYVAEGFGEGSCYRYSSPANAQKRVDGFIVPRDTTRTREITIHSQIPSYDGKQGLEITTTKVEKYPVHALGELFHDREYWQHVVTTKKVLKAEPDTFVAELQREEKTGRELVVARMNITAHLTAEATCRSLELKKERNNERIFIPHYVLPALDYLLNSYLSSE